MDATALAAQSARAFPSLEGPAVDILESSADKTTTPQTESQEENAVNPQKSDRLTEPSTREILATTLEGTAKTEPEQKVISEYIATIPKLNEQEWFKFKFLSPPKASSNRCGFFFHFVK